MEYTTEERPSSGRGSKTGKIKGKKKKKSRFRQERKKKRKWEDIINNRGRIYEREE